jgi:hypothetical protein
LLNSRTENPSNGVKSENRNRTCKNRNNNITTVLVRGASANNRTKDNGQMGLSSAKDVGHHYIQLDVAMVKPRRAEEQVLRKVNRD